MSRSQADVIIVGGGIMGAATAFFLRQRGRSVILLERGLVGQQASGTNFGNVRRQGRFLPQLPLANRSREIWGKLPELIQHDAEFLMSGHIRVCYREEQADQFEVYAKEASQYGLKLDLFRGAEMKARLAPKYCPHRIRRRTVMRIRDSRRPLSAVQRHVSVRRSPRTPRSRPSKKKARNFAPPAPMAARSMRPSCW